MAIFNYKMEILLLIFVTLFCSIRCNLIQERLESLKSCWSDNDCNANSFCFNNDVNKKGNCKCLDNYVIWRNVQEYECHLPSNYNEPCVRDVQCKINFSLGSCKNGKCECEDGSYYTSGNCYKIAGLNENCRNDLNCRSIDTKNMFCDEGKCQCRYMYHLNADGICIKTAHLGSQCINDDSCLSINARCFNGVCVCQTGFVQSNNLHQCIKAALGFNAPCEQLSQCDTYLEGAKCIENKCKCPLDHHPQGYKCYKNVRIGNICNNNKECELSNEYVDSVTCENNRCVCKENLHETVEECAINKENNGISNHFTIKTNFSIVIIIYLIILKQLLLLINY